MFAEDINQGCDERSLSPRCVVGLATLPFFPRFCHQGNQEQPLILWPLGITPGNYSNPCCDLGSSNLALQWRLDHKKPPFLPIQILKVRSPTQIKTESVWVSLFVWLINVALLVVSSGTGKQWTPCRKYYNFIMWKSCRHDNFCKNWSKRKGWRLL